MSQENSAVVAIGTILDGKFRVSKEIGHGGMATVYEAENIDIGKRVAIKVLSPELANSSVVTERFMREARAAAKIRSPYICDVYDVGTYSTRPFLVMELLEGESLYERLSRDRRLSHEDTLRIATETALGLAQAHQANIVHRDLKPENIFLARSGGGEQGTKIVDFGLAKFYEPHLEGGSSARLTKAGALFGTPAYMSPEQASAMGPVGHRSDLWALGCIVYEMLVGRTVWNVDQGVAMILAQIAGGPLPTPSRVRKDLPPAFDRWFLKALARDEERRFASAKELADALAEALTQPKEPAVAPPSGLEARRVDALVGSSGPPRSDALKPLVGRGSNSPNFRTSLPAALRNYRGRAIAGFLTVVALGVIALVAWSGLQNPAKFLRTISFKDIEEPIEREPYAQRLAVGQEQLADGLFKSAVTTFERAFEDGETKAARSLRSHAQAVDEAINEGPCKLRGLGHPRPFDAAGRTSRPSVAWTGDSLVYAWATTATETIRPIEVTRLDFALRRIAPTSLLTANTVDARDPQLIRSESGLALVYSKAAGKVSTVFVRQLDTKGTPLGPARSLTPAEGHYAYDPHLVGGETLEPSPEEGSGKALRVPGHWAVFSQSTHRRVHDLFVRRLDAELKPLSPAVQLTAYSLPRKRRRLAAQATIGAGPDLLTIAYREQRAGKYRVMLMRISPHSQVLSTAGVLRGTVDSKSTAEQPQELYAGDVVSLDETADAQSAPRVACDATGCFTVWSAENSGAHAVFSDPTTGEVIWKKHFAEHGMRPAVGTSKAGAVVTWYEESRVLIASISRKGLGKPSVIGRVGGLQPPPDVVPGEEAGQWYVAWRAFEAASFEPFLAQVVCPVNP